MAEVITEPEGGSGLRQKSTNFAEAGAGSGVEFSNENRTGSRSDNFSFTGVGQFILLILNFLWTANC